MLPSPCSHFQGGPWNCSSQIPSRGRGSLLTIYGVFKGMGVLARLEQGVQRAGKGHLWLPKAAPGACRASGRQSSPSLRAAFPSWGVFNLELWKFGHPSSPRRGGFLAFSSCTQGRGRSRAVPPSSAPHMGICASTSHLPAFLRALEQGSVQQEATTSPALVHAQHSISGVTF